MTSRPLGDLETGFRLTGDTDLLSSPELELEDDAANVLSSDSMIFSIVNRGLSILGRGTGGGAGGVSGPRWAEHLVRNLGSMMASPRGLTNMVPQQIFFLNINKLGLLIPTNTDLVNCEINRWYRGLTFEIH